MFTTLLVQPLLNVLFYIYAIIPAHDFGIAVILLTIIVRLILWPIVNRQLHSQRAMQALTPEIAKVKEKAGGDRQKETQMLMELYKERGTSPFASILPLLIQLPIFFALYIVLRDSIDPKQIAHLVYEPVRNLGPVADIIHHHIKFSPSLLGVIDLTKPSWILALTAAAAQFIQTRQLTPKNQNDSQAKMAASIGTIFPVITFGIALTLPSALALYWTVTSAVAIFQQHLVLQQDAHEMEEMPTEPKLKSKKARS